SLSLPLSSHYTLSLHDALPIFLQTLSRPLRNQSLHWYQDNFLAHPDEEIPIFSSQMPFLLQSTLLYQFLSGYYAELVREKRSERSEEHTSELQSRFDLVCRLLL